MGVSVPSMADTISFASSKIVVLFFLLHRNQNFVQQWLEMHWSLEVDPAQDEQVTHF